MRTLNFKNADDVRKITREFAEQEIRPVARRLDKLNDPQKVIEKGSEFWDLVRKSRELGFHRLSIPKAFGGNAGSVPKETQSIVTEEFAYGCPGFAISSATSELPFLLTRLSPEKSVNSLLSEFAQDETGELFGCWAITEPNHGSDWVEGIGPKGSNPKMTVDLKSEKKGDYYILNGQKSAWVTNGTTATHAALHFGIEPSKGIHGTGLAFCPLDLPGISKGKPLNKMGKRMQNQGEIFFDNVKLHKKYVIMGYPNALSNDMFSKFFLGTVNLATGTVYTGHCRAIYDETFRYLANTNHYGESLFEQKSNKIKLFQMFNKVEAASALCHKAHERFGASHGNPSLISKLIPSPKFVYALGGRIAHYMVNHPDPFLTKGPVAKVAKRLEKLPNAHPGTWGISCKTFSTQTSFELASTAMEIFGEEAMTDKYPIEKMFRDARSGLIEDGATESLMLSGADGLTKP